MRVSPLAAVSKLRKDEAGKLEEKLIECLPTSLSLLMEVVLWELDSVFRVVVFVFNVESNYVRDQIYLPIALVL